ncbi:hypothetical protein GRI34_07920 [Erythrobacter aquimaris]|uniref:Uncharacterized protein n=1 Tax=Qipengyuania aquimaris TaxID=255984 RepID=A0A6I4TMU5_9SPHN|nr:hypothetical protein [Qipengyuania aquimaris]MXO96347.1 hypothetical protein [Qipengyuania aquimaris]
MNHTSTDRRGQPLVFLFVLLAGWLTLRLMTWENPWPQELLRSLETPVIEQLAANEPAARAVPDGNAGEQDLLLKAPREMPVSLSAPPPAILPASADPPPHFVQDRSMSGHNLVWMAAMSRLPMPRSVAAALDRQEGSAQAAIPLPEGTQRKTRPWRFGGWLLLRGEGRSSLAGGDRPSSYGASQVGGVLSYRLSHSSSHQPAVYLRTSAALREPRESEAAFGLRARPLAGMPVQLHAEARLSDRSGQLEIRPALFATAGIERNDLPLGVKIRGYGQVGYVAGTYSSAFVDGMAVAEREVARFDLEKIEAHLSAGAGAWGGAQKGASRLDVGPSASMDVRMGGVSARLSLDYRVRVAGDAEPGNGPAFTLSTGF